MNEAAWAAGFFEGEGCVRSCPSGRPRKDGSQYHTLRIYTSNTELPLMERFLDVIGVGKLTERECSGLGTKKFWSWDAAGTVAEQAMSILAPYMVGAKLKKYKLLREEEESDEEADTS